MALSGEVWFEVRSDGNDNNGGGFKQGATGTDRSQQAASHATLTAASLVNATTTIIDVDSGDYTCTDADVGNLLQIHGGTATAGTYEITARSAQQWTLDRSAGTAGQTVVGDMGGARATIQSALDTYDNADQMVWVKKTSGYTITAGITVPTVGTFTDRKRIVGYNTTRGDADTIGSSNRPTITVSGSSIVAFTLSDSGTSLENFIINCNSQTTSTGVVISTNYQTCYNVTVQNATSNGFNRTGGNDIFIVGCEVDSCTGGTAAFFSNGGRVAYVDCWSHDNSVDGFKSNAATQFKRCRSTNNTGQGYDLTGVSIELRNCVAHGNSSHGLDVGQNYPSIIVAIEDCIFTNNGGYGIDFTTAHTESSFEISQIRNNAFRSNTSGDIGTWDDPHNADAPKITLTADPYTNAASDDYTLNNTAGGGAACRNAGVNDFDVGYSQHADAGGGGGATDYAFSS